MDLDTNWCPVCDKAIHPSLESLYCSQECLQYDALQRNPLLGYDFKDFKDFLRPSPSRQQPMQHQQPRTPLSLVVAPSSSSQQQSPSTAPLSPSSSSIYSNDSSSAESPLLLTPRSQPPILNGSPPKLDLGLSYCNYHHHHQHQQPTHIANRAAGVP
ncbi:hypothetical protein O0I10_005722 [Lichtheimia ornata]|uniref:Uncharacterized protein n=1 Tax=Lichtheimia ornata TaxID=688661 RepID=A0AAD7V5X8_9FUNG|nr:uncharacterized protein O0I10_005722 [Lichtheimia ornata]KAJ8658682.1 hypothetical protein O0I10_005722 [Lichtheimia ornata]